MANTWRDLVTDKRKCRACKQYKDGGEFKNKASKTCGPCESIIKKADENEKLRKERDQDAQIRRIPR